MVSTQQVTISKLLVTSYVCSRREFLRGEQGKKEGGREEKTGKRNGRKIFSPCVVWRNAFPFPGIFRSHKFDSFHEIFFCDKMDKLV